MVWNKNKEKNGEDTINCDIPLGTLCCFKPLDADSIYYGHMAGMVVDNFENMSFMYVLNCDGEYYFSRELIVKPIGAAGTHTEARKLFNNRQRECN